MPTGTILTTFLITMTLVHQVQNIHFCFLKEEGERPDENTIDPEIPNLDQTVDNQSQFRSYHPHYLVSLSYPHPITPHIYYGQVIGDKPLFLYTDMDRWHPKSIQKLIINGVQLTDASAKYYLLRRQQQFRYMFVIQIENSYEKQINHTMHVYQRNDHFLITCHYQNTTNAYFLYLTQNGNVLPINQTSHPGIRLYVRNQSSFNGRMNWRFSRFVRWAGGDRFYNRNLTQFHGFVLEIQYNDRKLMDTVKLNVKQAKINPQIPIQLFLLDQNQAFFASAPETITKVQKFSTCSVTAREKVFDGLSYQYGRLSIRDGRQVINNNPKQLLSFCPSVKRFPWGFLWDEGFHCQVAVRKNPKLVLKVIKSWLDTMLDSGWIPRQQNRGAQREQLCNCPRFMQKDIKDGNPPTLLLALAYLNRQKMLNSNQLSAQYWQKLKKWYHWFIRTQKDSDALIFRWHDSIYQQGASFTSGLDDFPRPYQSKGHIDLQSWMYFFTKFMVETSHLYNQDNSQYIANLELIKNNFNFFLSRMDNTYRDFAVDNSFSAHFGYPNILPIAFGIPAYQSIQYNSTLAKIVAELDIGQGLASLSKKSPLFLSNPEAYWRGPVWININYLFLRGLKLYYPQEERLYKKLRQDLLRVVCGNWQKSGYFYQNYINGRGSFGHPFNGWTSLIAIIWEQSY